MDNDTEKNQDFSSKEVAKRLGIETVTLRKYSQELENNGYEFKKNARGWRVFLPDDLKALAYFQVLRNRGKSVSESAAKVAELQQSSLVVTDTDITLQDYDTKSDIEKFMEQQQSFNQELIKRLDKQQEYIDNRLQERDKNLMNAMDHLLEQKQHAATKEKKRWWQFWKQK